MITRRISELEPDHFGQCAAGEPCFLCGQVVNDPAIMWAGMTSTIYLHGPCAILFTGKLINDVHDLYKKPQKSKEGAA